MAYLKSDDQGFLTGKRLKNSDLVDEFKAMEKSLRSIERTVGGIMALLRGMNTKPAESASTAQAKPVTPVGGKRKQPEIKISIDVKTEEKKVTVRTIKGITIFTSANILKVFFNTILFDKIIRKLFNVMP